MEAADMDNDTRGWIMCIVSGIACVMGACVVCVDLVIPRISGKQNFAIQDSNTFLACSLSLSFGVMIFSSLFGMLSESRSYLKKNDWDDTRAGLIMIGCFVGGFIGIQSLSRLLHQLMPSHVVDCDHSHEQNDTMDNHKHSHDSMQRRHSSRIGRIKLRNDSSNGRRITTLTELHTNGHAGNEQLYVAPSESMPLLRSSLLHDDPQQTDPMAGNDSLRPSTLSFGRRVSRRPSMLEVRNRVMSFVKDTKSTCDVDGPCFGYSDLCGQECLKHMSSRTSMARKSSLAFAGIGSTCYSLTAPVFEEILEVDSDGSGTHSPLSPTSLPAPLRRASHVQSREPLIASEPTEEGHGHSHTRVHSEDEDNSCDQMFEDLEAQAHHHHVPTNAFLSIGLQTVIAIALHKFPEGFITYATNHANPQLGFNVFMALFVHNVAEGFSMALPLYMALQSRLKAIAWSSLLGGLSQPIGAGIAWLVIKIISSPVGDSVSLAIDNTAYAILFAGTAGIMTSVALQLFVESLSLSHDRNLSILFGFLGMVLLGITSAVSGHSH